MHDWQYDDISGRINTLERGQRDVNIALRQAARPPGRSKPKEPSPGSLLWRSLASRFASFVAGTDPNKSSVDLREKLAGDLEIVTRATSVPATTSATGWAAELTGAITNYFVDSLAGSSAFGILAGAGGARRVSLTPSEGVLRLVTPGGARPTVNGAFIGESLPIPVRRANLAPVNAGPRKIGVISIFSEELSERSTPAIESVIRDIVTTDTSLALDSALIDSAPASVIRPAGLLNGVTPITASALTPRADAMADDLSKLAAAVQPSSRVGLICNPVQCAVLPTDNPIFVPIPSVMVPVGTVIGIDLASLMIVDWGPPAFALSAETTLHFEGADPLAIGTAGSPATIAAPSGDLFQQDLIALRLLWRLNWILSRAAAVAVIVNVKW